MFSNTWLPSGAITLNKGMHLIYIPLAVKAVAIFRGCEGSYEPSLVACAMGNIISRTGSFQENTNVNIQ